MRCAINGALAALVVITICGCSTGRLGWVTDSEQFWTLSGFEVKAPSGPNWYRLEKEEIYPNAISFVNLEHLPFRLTPEAYDFTITKVAAFGVPVNKLLVGSDERVQKDLEELLNQFAEKAGFVVRELTFDTSLSARCLNYHGKPVQPDEASQFGTIRTDSVSGFLCLHPDYQDFLVCMHSMNGASVRMKPANRNDQTDHFFRSIRFTPRLLPSKPGEPSKDEGKFLRS